MNIKGFLKQTVSYEPKTGASDWGDSTFGAPITLPARVEEKQNMVRAAGGIEVLSTTRIMLVQEVQVGDRLNGLEVQGRESIVDVSGKTLGWTVYL